MSSNQWLAALISMFLAILIGAGSTYYVKDRLDTLRQDTALESQINTDRTSCAADKQITKESYDGLQSKINLLNLQLNASSRVYIGPTTCVPVAQPAAKRNDTSKSGKSTGQNGINAQALISYAGEAERYRLQLISCQGFVRDVWKAKGQ